MTILELREKRNKAWEAAKAFVETKRDKDGLLSAEDAATYAEMEQKVQNYSAEIARMEEMEAMEAELGDINTILREGRIAEITKWLNEKIHRFGSTRAPNEVITAVCHKEVTAKPIIKFFKEKYNELYGI